MVVESENLRKGYGDKLLIEDLSFTLRRGMVVVMRPNGAGKTTLFRMIVGDEEPDAGEPSSRRVGRAGLSSSPTRDALDPDKSVSEGSSDGYDNIKVGEREMNSRAYWASTQGVGSAAQGRRALGR